MPAVAGGVATEPNDQKGDRCGLRRASARPLPPRSHWRRAHDFLTYVGRANGFGDGERFAALRGCDRPSVVSAIVVLNLNANEGTTE